MEITYRQEKNYLLPNLALEDQPEGRLGKYGMMRKQYLKEHRKGAYAELLLKGTLQAHLLETDRAAREQIGQTMAQMAKSEGVTESLKARDQMAWVQRMNNIRQRAEETAIAEIVHS